MGVASRRGWALDWSVIIVKGPAWITYSDWRRDMTHTHTHICRHTQVSGPMGCLIHNLALLLLLSLSALFGLDCVWKSETRRATLLSYVNAKLWSAGGCTQMHALICTLTHAHTRTCRWLTFSHLAGCPGLGSGPANNYKMKNKPVCDRLSFVSSYL